MPVTCCAPSCKNRRKAGSAVRFYGLPLKNKSRLSEWLSAMDRCGFAPTRTTKICSEHFVATDFTDKPDAVLQRLKPDAVPSVFVRSGGDDDRDCVERGERCDAMRPTNGCDDRTVYKTVAMHDVARTNASSNGVLRQKVRALSQNLRRKELLIRELKGLIETGNEKNGHGLRVDNDDMTDNDCKSESNICRACRRSVDCLTTRAVYNGSTQSLHSDAIASCFADATVNATTNYELCNNCADSLRAAYEFKNMLLSSEQMFRDCLDNRTSTDAYGIKTEENLVQMFDDTDAALSVPPYADNQLCVEDEEFLDDVDENESLHKRKKHFQCDQCEKSFTQRLKLLRHEKLHESDGGSTNCIVRFVAVPMDETTDNYRCEHCDAVFASKPLLCEHLQAEHGSTKPPVVSFDCTQCDKRFPDAAKLEKHASTHRKHFACELCDKLFVYKYKLTKHMKAHNGVKPFKCSYCDKSFTTSMKVKNHEGVHTGVKQYLCKLCGRAYIHSKNLSRHLKVHKDVKPYRTTNHKQFVCEICGKAYIHSQNLTRHMKIHSNVKPFKCDHCDETFSYYHKYKLHELRHLGLKPFMCQFCSKRFYQKETLMAHEKRHQRPIEKQFECKHCGKRLMSVYTLRIHEKIHTDDKPYACKYCSKRFIMLHGLVVHERVHTGERPYKCRYCDKEFTSQLVLNGHERIHTGQKVYCRHCNKAFTSKANCVRHEKIHATEKGYQYEYCDKSFGDGFADKAVDRPYKCRHCDKMFSRLSTVTKHEQRVHVDQSINN